MLRVTLALATAAALCPSAGCGTVQKPSAQPSPAATVTVTATPAPTRAPTPTSRPTRKAIQLPTHSHPAPVDLSRYDLPGFTTPSGNIGCQFDHYEGRPHIRCDRLAMDHVPGGKPVDCDFDWGHSVELSASSQGALACTSDSVMGQPGETDGSRELPYGDFVTYRGITCTSTQQGLICTTKGRHVFQLSRAAITVS